MARGSGAAPRRGRPPSPPDETKRHAFGFRTTKRIKELIERASQESGRSVAQEIEMRIEKSFLDEGLAEQVFEAAYGKRMAALMRLVAWAMHDAGISAAMRTIVTMHQSDEAWLYHPFSYDQAVRAAVAVLEHYRPEGDRSPPTDGLWIGVPGDSLRQSVDWLTSIGDRVAAALVNAVDKPELCGEPDDIIERARPIREKLGPYIGGRIGRFIRPSAADQSDGTVEDGQNRDEPRP